MRARKLIHALCLFGVALLAACSGGNTISGESEGGDGGGGSTTPTVTPASITLTTSSSTLASDADTLAEGVTLTAYVKDASNVLLSDVPVTFSVSSGDLGNVSSTTDSSGKATAVLFTATDSSLRTITATATVSGLPASTVTVQVVPPGSSTPTAPGASNLELLASSTELFSTADQLSEGVTLTAVVTNSAQTALAGAPVTFSITSGIGRLTPSGDGTTDANGEAAAVLTTGANSTAPRTIVVTATVNTGSTILTDTFTVNVVRRVASIELTTSAPQLRSDADTASEGVTLTAILRDGNNRLVEGVTVDFSSNGGGVQTTRGSTDATGTAAALLTTAGDPSIRTITVTATAEGATGTIDVDVAGTRLTISGVEAIGSQQTVTYTVTLVDAGGVALSQRSVNLSVTNSSNTLSATTVTTNSSGQAQFTVTGNVGGSETISASALGVTTTKTIGISAYDLAFSTPSAGTDINFDVNQTVTVVLRQNGQPQVGETMRFSTTRGTLSSSVATTNASGEATVTVSSSGSSGAGLALITAIGPQSLAIDQRITASLEVEFVATTPATIELQAEPLTISTNSSSTIRAVVRDADGNLVKNQTVLFSQPTTDPTGGVLSGSTALTDSLGAASITYTSGSSTSGDQGVEIEARVQGTAISDSVSLTVGGRALRITLGTGNELFEEDTTSYRMPFSAIITDSAGNPAPQNTVFRLKLLSLEYEKGFYVAVDTDADGEPDAWAPGYTAQVDAPAEFGCLNEDVNNNGILDLNEDVSGNGALDLAEDFDGDGRIDVREDVDNDGRLDVDEDVDNDGAIDVDEDTDNDGRLDVNEDVDGDGRLDIDEDLDGDRRLDVNEDTNSNGVLDAGEDKDGDGRLDVNEDADGDGNLDIDEDVDNDGRLDANEDVDGDGRLDVDEDIDNDGNLDVDEDIDNDGNLDVDEDIDNDGNLDVNEDVNNNLSLDAGEDLDGDGQLDRGEDVNDNGVLDVAQDLDTNANGRLEPGNVGSVPTTVDLDANGRAFFEVIYPKSKGNWVFVRLVAVASVDGTETLEDISFVLPVLAKDVNSLDIAPPGTVGPSGRVESPYGTASRCANPS